MRYFKKVRNQLVIWLMGNDTALINVTFSGPAPPIAAQGPRTYLLVSNYRESVPRDPADNRPKLINMDGPVISGAMTYGAPLYPQHNPLRSVRT